MYFKFWCILTSWVFNLCTNILYLYNPTLNAQFGIQPACNRMQHCTATVNQLKKKKGSHIDITLMATSKKNIIIYSCKILLSFLFYSIVKFSFSSLETSKILGFSEWLLSFLPPPPPPILSRLLPQPHESATALSLILLSLFFRQTGSL